MAQSFRFYTRSNTPMWPRTNNQLGKVTAVVLLLLLYVCNSPDDEVTSESEITHGLPRSVPCCGADGCRCLEDVGEPIPLGRPFDYPLNRISRKVRF